MKKIVVGVDGSESSRAALRFALSEAVLIGDAEVVAVGAWRQPVYPADGMYATTVGVGVDLGPGCRTTVEKAVAAVRLPSDPEPSIETHLGPPSLVLVDAAAEAVELVVGSRGRGPIAGVLLGSVSHQVANHARCPVVIVPATVDEPTPPGRGHVIVVGTDGSENAAAALRWALDRAGRTGSTVRVVHAWQDEYVTWLPPGVPHSSAARAETIRNLAGDRLSKVIAEAHVPPEVVVEPVLREGPAVDVLRDVGRRGEMVVLGARGHGGFTGLLLGSVAGACLNHLEVTTVVVPGTRTDETT